MGMYHLIQFTFIDNNHHNPLNLDYMDELHNNLVKRAGKRGLEVSWSGGSQGHYELTSLIQKHLRHANG
eukprot:10120452-Ditylum_brightwellii.AAC.1